jgi:hypothetical protein
MMAEFVSESSEGSGRNPTYKVCDHNQGRADASNEPKAGNDSAMPDDTSWDHSDIGVAMLEIAL